MTAHKFVNTLLCEMIWRRQAMPGFEVSLTIVYIRLAKCGVTFFLQQSSVNDSKSCQEDNEEEEEEDENPEDLDHQPSIGGDGLKIPESK